ncbi:MAG: methionine adenosyltransferase [Desulfobacteraceae bacterium]|jgi:S-adenosylmethionine synthetase
MMQDVMYTSESVTEGHPDKLCDQISDAIVDHLLSRDPQARVRAECAVSRAIVFIAARFASEANIDFTRLARKVIGRIGYDHPDFNPQSCSILTSPRVLPMADADRFDEMEMPDDAMDTVTADNQVTVFGFACNHTAALMPLPISLAHGIARRLSKARRDRNFAFLMPDAKVQVGIEFKNRTPSRVYSVTMDVHLRDTKLPRYSRMVEAITREVIEPVILAEQIQFDAGTHILINPNGAYAGGPMNHSGLTGRKNAVDTYGEYSRHSGKALSGKDPLRIDRTGAYAARYAAKNIVAAGLADECEVILSYAAGQAHPVSLIAQTNGTGRVDDRRLTRLVQTHFDFRPASILKRFRLRQLSSERPAGFYQHLAAYGHFGREDLDLPWEKTEMAERLRSKAS